MNYEIVNWTDSLSSSWKSQVQRLKNSGGKFMSLAPDSGMRDVLINEGVDGINLIDLLAKRTVDFDKSSFLYFNRTPTVDGSEIFMNEDFSIDIISNGDIIGHIMLWPILRRHVKQAVYVYQNGDKDYTEEYASDGKKFSNITYTRNDIQRIDFYDDDEKVRVRFFFYLNQLNFITIENPDTHQTIANYNNMDELVSTEVGKLLTPQDTVGITYMGIELTALSKTSSNNTLYLSEDPLNSDGQIKGNLLAILNNKIPFIQNVVMSNDQYEKINMMGILTDKIKINS